MKETTKVKLLKEVTMEIHDEDIDFDESLISLTLHECTTCHWRFYGDAMRFGYGGFDEEGQQTPNYCPMCGRKIEDNFTE